MGGLPGSEGLGILAVFEADIEDSAVGWGIDVGLANGYIGIVLKGAVGDVVEDAVCIAAPWHKLAVADNIDVVDVDVVDVVADVIVAAVDGGVDCLQWYTPAVVSMNCH